MKFAAIGLAVVFALVGLYYIIAPPHHLKHFVLFEILAALSLVWLRFQAGKPTTPSLR